MMPFEKIVALLDDVVRSDGPVFKALLSVNEGLDSKDMTDRPMKLLPAEVLHRFASAAPMLSRSEVEKRIKECFFTGFPDVCKWMPLDFPKEPPSWLSCSKRHSQMKEEQKREGDTIDRASHTKPSSHFAFSVARCEKTSVVLQTCGQQPVDADTPELTAHEETKLAEILIDIWPSLGRTTDISCLATSLAAEEASCPLIVTTLLDLPHGFIVPGGRDAYWTIRGLLYSGMVSTARGMILNFADLVRRFGFIPNGTRTYYLTRSQPPVFSMMLAVYFAFIGDLEMVRETYLEVEREYFYWMEDRNRQVQVTVNGTNCFLQRYIGHRSTPRLEGWKEDVFVADCVMERARKTCCEEPEQARANVLRNIRAAAESGWDFSSRFVSDDVDVARDAVKFSLRTESILPVDLNRQVEKSFTKLFLYHTELYLLHFGRLFEQSGPAELLGKKRKSSDFFQQRAEERRKAMIQTFWNSELSWWFDYDIVKGRKSTRVTAAGVVPLLMQLHSPVKKQLHRLFGCLHCGKGASVRGCSCVEFCEADRRLEVEAYKLQLLTVQFLVDKSGLWKPWGLSTTLFETDEQWDGSNCWPPLLQMATEAIVILEDPLAVEAVKRMADKHLLSCMHAYKRLGALPEKSSSLVLGSCGGGGEYECQQGFGWSIGLALELLCLKRAAFFHHELRRLQKQFGLEASQQSVCCSTQV
ncbi:hypothetical protein Efla_003077 [Eimeria flavescens]